jgi:hypothetical protein
VTRGDYRIETIDGPLTIEVVAVDLHERSVRLGDAIASDRLVSDGETISSMAQRTHAVAGINADYFDIGQTNQPLGIVVHDGALVRTPSRRVALAVDTDGGVHFEKFTFSGSVRYGTYTIPLTSVDEWPPQGGAAFLTPAFGALPAIGDATRDVTLVSLAALGSPDQVAGDYRVLGVYPSTSGPLGSPTLALGPAALAIAPPPAPGDVVTIAADTSPSLSDLAQAVGGGPLLVANGMPYDDPDAPAPEERTRRFPVSGAALTSDQTLLLLAVDGRQPSLSIGLTRPEFGALMRGLGAQNGMAFDSGGSATLVARRPGDTVATLLNVPSDGTERPVADGLFVYSTAPLGPPARLVLRPAHIIAVRGAHVRVSAAITDAAGHFLRSAPGFEVDAEGSRTIPVRVGTLRADLPVDVVDRVATLRIDPERPNPDPNGLVQLVASASDASGRPIDVDGAVRWSADAGAFLEPGLYRAQTRDALVTAAAGGAIAKTIVHVGRHEVALRVFPAAGVDLDYDFTGSQRFAYANQSLPLPGDPLSFSIDVNGDGSGVAVRAAFVNRFGERMPLTLAKRVDWHGWRRCAIAIPGALNPPITLVSLYAVNSLGTPPVHAAGTLAFRDPIVVLPGTR